MASSFSNSNIISIADALVITRAIEGSLTFPSYLVLPATLKEYYEMECTARRVPLIVEMEYDLHRGNLTVVSPGDVVIMYRNDLFITIPITTLVGFATFEPIMSDEKVESGHMLWSLLRILAKQENAKGVALYMKVFDPYRDEYVFFIMGVCGDYSFKKFF